MSRVAPRLMELEVDEVDRSDEISKGIIKSAKAGRDFMSWAESRGGGARDYFLDLTIAQDHASGTLWDLVWTGAGTLVSGVYAPYGNATPSPTQPHYGIEVKVVEPEGDFLGAESNDDVNGVAVIEVSWPLVGKPTKITA